MPILEDIQTAIDNYPEENVDVSVTDYVIIAPGGSSLNTNDKAQFKVNVTNSGELDMLSTTVRVNGTQFADVSVDNINFSSSATSAAFTVSAQGSQKTALFYLKAKAATSGSQDIVTARIQSWDAGWDHLLKAHSTAGPSEGKLNKQVFPS